MAEWVKAAESALLGSQVEPVIGETGFMPQSCSSSGIGTRKSPAKGRGASWDSVRFMIFDMMVLKSEGGQGWLLALTEVNSPKPTTELFTSTFGRCLKRCESAVDLEGATVGQDFRPADPKCDKERESGDVLKG